MFFYFRIVLNPVIYKKILFEIGYFKIYKMKCQLVLHFFKVQILAKQNRRF